jgi:hypothetical protein
MREKARELAAKFLLVAATFVAVMGYNFTGNYAFVALPFLSGVALGVLTLRRPVEVQASQEQNILRLRRHALIQLVTSSLMAASMGIYYWLVIGNNDKALGYAIMLGALAPLGIMAFITKAFAPVGRPQRRRVGG